MKKRTKTMTTPEAAWRFVCKDKARRNICEPWISGGNLVATNGHVMCVFPNNDSREGRAILRDGRDVAAWERLPPTATTTGGDHGKLITREHIERVNIKPEDIKVGALYMRPDSGEVGLLWRSSGRTDNRDAFDLHYVALVVSTALATNDVIEEVWLSTERHMLRFVCASKATYHIIGIRL